MGTLLAYLVSVLSDGVPCAFSYNLYVRQYTINLLLSQFKIRFCLMILINCEIWSESYLKICIFTQL